LITSGEKKFCANYLLGGQSAYSGQEAKVKILKIYRIDNFGWVNPPQNLICPCLAVETDWIAQVLDGF